MATVGLDPGALVRAATDRFPFPVRLTAELSRHRVRVPPTVAVAPAATARVPWPPAAVAVPPTDTLTAFAQVVPAPEMVRVPRPPTSPPTRAFWVVRAPP